MNSINFLMAIFKRNANNRLIIFLNGASFPLVLLIKPKKKNFIEYITRKSEADGQTYKS